MSNVSKRKREGSRSKIKSMGDHKEFLRRITKTLYYGHLPSLPCLSLPLTEISCEEWSVSQRGRSLRRLHADAAAGIARQACVSPAALVLALLYLERLRTSRPDYLAFMPPNELFLVSLMVGNKFLQDDGEDEEVMCSEWAASGGLDLNHLKKLELEFLSAMDWNIFVGEQHFEVGLRRLERRVALKQAALRGFFTYSDLQASGDGAVLVEALRALAASCALAALGYLGSLLALLASALVVAHVCLPQPRLIAPLAAPAPLALPVDGLAAAHSPLPLSFAANATLDPLSLDAFLRESATNPVLCCTQWLRYRQTTPRRIRSDSVVVYDWKSFEPWWSRTSVLNWLYQSSLVNPMQRWLEKIKEYADLLKQALDAEPLQADTVKCEDYDKVKDVSEQRCVRQWLNLSKLSALVVSISDR